MLLLLPLLLLLVVLLSLSRNFQGGRPGPRLIGVAGSLETKVADLGEGKVEADKRFTPLPRTIVGDADFDFDLAAKVAAAVET